MHLSIIYFHTRQSSSLLIFRSSSVYPRGALRRNEFCVDTTHHLTSSAISVYLAIKRLHVLFVRAPPSVPVSCGVGCLLLGSSRQATTTVKFKKMQSNQSTIILIEVEAWADGRQEEIWVAADAIHRLLWWLKCKQTINLGGWHCTNVIRNWNPFCIHPRNALGD